LTEIFEKNRSSGQRGGCNVSVGRYKYSIAYESNCVARKDIRKLITPELVGLLRHVRSRNK